MLFGDWDLDTVTDSDFPAVAQLLFFAFVLIGPLVMLNIVIAILGNTFDSVMDSKNEVLLQLQLHETLALEHIYDAYLGCLCGKQRVLRDEVGRKPRWLHILREVRTRQRRSARIQRCGSLSCIALARAYHPAPPATFTHSHASAPARSSARGR